MSFSISWVLPRLAVGSAPENAADARRLASLGVTDVLDMRMRPTDLGVSTANADAIYAGLGIEYHNTQMLDNGTQKSVAQYVDAVTFVRNALLRANTKVFVHCAAGQYRSPATVYAVLRAMGDSADVAWSRITSVRRVYNQYLPGAEASVPSLPHVVLGNETTDGTGFVVAAITGLLVYLWTRLPAAHARANPTPASPFSEYVKDTGTLVVGPDTIRAYSPSALREATKLLVSKFRLPISLAMVLTSIPVAGESLYVVFLSIWSSKTPGHRELVINVFSDGKIPPRTVDSLQAAGFSGPREIGWMGRGSKMTWEGAEDPRE